MKSTDTLTIGELAARTGLSVSAVRYYEMRGLVTARRSAGRHRQFQRADIRRVSFVRIAQSLGLSIEDVLEALSALPEGRTPNAADWRTISTRIKMLIEARIAELERTRDRLDGCIGCGCLSLKKCALYNPDDRAAKKGAGPRYVLGDKPV